MLMVAGLGMSRSAQAQGNNQPPYAANDYAMTAEEHSTVINILSNDYGISAPLNPSSVTIESYPLYGEIVVSSTTGSVLYIPDPGFYGMDGFMYTVDDTNGRVSNVASVMIGVMEDMSAPVIENFGIVPDGSGAWIVEGTVVDDHPSGIKVTFGGLLAGTTVYTQADGSFSEQLSLSPGESGDVYAQATNRNGITSNYVYEYVSN